MAGQAADVDARQRRDLGPRGAGLGCGGLGLLLRNDRRFRLFGGYGRSQRVVGPFAVLGQRRHLDGKRIVGIIHHDDRAGGRVVGGELDRVLRADRCSDLCDRFGIGQGCVYGNRDGLFAGRRLRDDGGCSGRRLDGGFCDNRPDGHRSVGCARKRTVCKIIDEDRAGRADADDDRSGGRKAGDAPGLAGVRPDGNDRKTAPRRGGCADPQGNFHNELSTQAPTRAFIHCLELWRRWVKNRQNVRRLPRLLTRGREGRGEFAQRSASAGSPRRSRMRLAKRRKR
ncbi:hypothetical protein [Mesorhizobium marinum]|uniref:hypothetical protein n=1 Tax=Mesorhizobium marinum TaxID=3228790 RepID=UPI003466A384